MEAVVTGVGVTVTRGRLIQVISHAFTDLGILPQHRDLVNVIAGNVMQVLFDLADAEQRKPQERRPAEIVFGRTYRRMPPTEWDKFVNKNLGEPFGNPCSEIPLDAVPTVRNHAVVLDESSALHALKNKHLLTKKLMETNTQFLVTNDVQPDHVVGE